MRFPLGMTTKLSTYIAGKRMRGVDKFPLVMMLEPLHACNLTCTGCGRIREYKDTITEQMTVEQCLKAVDECGSPIVSICGGEPTIYRPLAQLVTEILDRGKHIYLCTHGMFIKKRYMSSSQHRSSSLTFTSTAWRRLTTSASSAKAYSSRPSTGFARLKMPDLWSARTRRFTNKPT